MKIRAGFELKTVDGKQAIVGNGVSLPVAETSSLLFSELQKGERTKEQLMHLLLDNFDISTVLALNNIDMFVKTLLQNGIIEE